MMMTDREQKLIEALKKSEVLTIDDMLSVTETSRRTLYRDLESIQETLSEIGLILRREKDGYSLEGDLEKLSPSKSIKILDARERRLVIITLLLLENRLINELLGILGITKPTLTKDLKFIEEVLNINGASLKRGKKLSISCNVDIKRKILVGIIFETTSPLEFFKFNDEKIDNPILILLDMKKVQTINQAFQNVNLELPDRVELIIRLYFLSMIIIPGTLEQVGRASNDALKINGEISSNLPFKITENDRMYLSQIIDLAYDRDTFGLFMSGRINTDFSYKISKFINLMSQEFSIDFERDRKLFDLLKAHMRMTLLLPTFLENVQDRQLISQIKDENEEIFLAVGRNLKKIFERSFSMREIAYITLHLVSTLERSGNVLPLRSLLITSSGIVTTELLSRSIRTQFPFVKEIDIIQATKVSSCNLYEYDVLFSTEDLECQFDYIKINEILDVRNFGEISVKLREIQRTVKRKSLPPKKIRTFSDFSEFFRISSDILENFKLGKIYGATNLYELTNIVGEMLSPEVSADGESLSKLIYDRFQKTPFGIPETNMALLHGASDIVKKPHFEILDIDQAIELLGMDKKKIKATRVIVFLAPKEISEVTRSLLGKISSSIIENKLYMAIYNSGNYDVIYELLNQIITDSLREYED
ncbi:PRD domain-containing protein [Streptococcaceae bacterium ESL0729]|nr:PRD domain-containing protein [Streptococcaceae bacterium ESL0729]